MEPVFHDEIVFIMKKTDEQAPPLAPDVGVPSVVVVDREVQQLDISAQAVPPCGTKRSVSLPLPPAIDPVPYATSKEIRGVIIAPTVTRTTGLSILSKSSSDSTLPAVPALIPGLAK